MLRILIIGASRGIGLKAVSKGLEHNYRIRAFARSADKIPIRHANLEKWPGNAQLAADITNALHSVDIVIQTLGIPLNLSLLLEPTQIFSNSTKILIEEMEILKVPRLLSVTGFGSGDSKDSIHCFQKLPFKIVFGHAYSDKTLQEDLIKKSSLDWVIARPGILTNLPEKNQYQVLTNHSEWRNGLISRADVAHFLIQQVEHDNYIGKTAVLIN